MVAFLMKFGSIVKKLGLAFVGKDESGRCMEILELPSHPYYVGTQFHSEFKSRPVQHCSFLSRLQHFSAKLWQPLVGTLLVQKFAFVEMRPVEEASNAMASDGIIFEGALVNVRRPSDYNPSLAAALGPSQPSSNLNLAVVGLMPGSAGGLEVPNRIFVGGLPYYFTEAQVRELLESFGPLRGFDLVKDKETGNTKGYAFCVYQDLSITDIACAALNGINMGDKTLIVRRANQGSVQPRLEQRKCIVVGTTAGSFAILW